MAGIGGSDGSFYEDHFDQVTGNNSNDPDTASGMALEASRKAAGALKRAKGTLPTFDSDTGINGPVLHSISGLREQGIDPNITEGQENQATDLAMSFSGGGLTFGGVRSATMNKDLLALANKAESEGIGANDIYKGTGFFKGADRRWRYEIDDSRADLDPTKLRNFTRPLHEVLDHPDLYEAYPWMKNIGVRIDPQRHPDSAGFTDQGKENGYIVLGSNAAYNKGTLLHEVQHAIQNYEGFAQGGSPGRPQDYTLKYQKAVDPLRKEWFQMQDDMLRNPAKNRSPDFLKRYDYLRQVLNTYNKYSEAGRNQAKENYLRLAGETEARNVDTRTIFSERERMDLNPLDTEDVTRKGQLVFDTPVMTTPYTDKALMVEGYNPKR